MIFDVKISSFAILVKDFGCLSNILSAYRALINTLLLIVLPFVLIYGVFDNGYLIFDVKLLFFYSC